METDKLYHNLRRRSPHRKVPLHNRPWYIQVGRKTKNRACKSPETSAMSPNGRRQLDNREDLLIRYVKMSLITLILYLCFSAEADSRRHRRMFTTELAHCSFSGASTLLRMRSRIFAANRRHQTRGRSRFFFQCATKRRKQNILFDIALRLYLDMHSVKLHLSISTLYFLHLKSLA